jgi:DedD protein
MTPVMAAPARDPRTEYSEDTEITLGTGKMLALFFGLVILCATFFGLGYSIGHGSAKSSAELLPSPSTSRPSRQSPSSSATNSAPVTQAPSDSKTADTQQAAPDSTNSSATPSTPDQDTPLTPPQPVASYFVQVAAVSKQEDAQALVESLKGRQYQAFIAEVTPDKLFHVQVGRLPMSKKRRVCAHDW